jgi:hypothetical protein
MTSPLDRCVGDIDTREHAGCFVQIEWSYDHDMGPPDSEHSGHGVVCPAGVVPLIARPLNDASDRRDRIYYDLAASHRIAIADGWGLSPERLKELTCELGRAPLPGEIATAAVNDDARHLRGWYTDEWCWLVAKVAVMVHTVEGDFCLDGIDTLGGVESSSAGEDAEELFERATAWIDENQSRIDEIANSFMQFERLRATLTFCR